MPPKKSLPLPLVKVSATFVFCKEGGKAAPFIQDPIDLSKLLDATYPNDYDELVENLQLIVEDPNSDLFFQRDSKNLYSFDQASLQNGAVYARKSKKDPNQTKATTSKLQPIQTSEMFKQHVFEVSECVLKEQSFAARRSRSKKKKNTQISHFDVELCIVLIKTKIVNKPAARSARTSGLDSGSQSSELPSTISTSNRGKRKRDQPFSFQARKISILLFAPIETQQRKSTTITGVPSGKTNKEVSYDLEPFITTVCQSDDASASSSAESESDDGVCTYLLILLLNDPYL